MSKEFFKVKKGLMIQGVTADPTDAEEGDIIFRTDLTPPRFRIYRGSQWADLNDTRYFRLVSTNDNTSGSNVALTAPATPFIRLTNSGLSSINTIPAGENGQIIVLANATGSVVTINNDTGTPASNRILTGTLKPLKMKNGATVILSYDSTTARWRTIGGGGAEIDGVATRIEEDLKAALIDSYFELLTANIFAIDEANKVDTSSTGTYNIADSTFDFAANTAQTMVSTNMLDPQEFIANADALAEVELMAYWRLSNIDTSATYQVSRNGGLAWQTVTMERVGNTDLYRGYHRFTDETINQTLYSPVITGDLDSTNQLSQSFVIPSGEKKLIKSTTLTLTKTGSPAGYIYVAICADNSGSPGTVLSESEAILANSLTTGVNTVNIPDIYLAAGTYHIRVRSDAAYKASYVNGVTELNFSASSIVGINLDLRVRITSSATAGIKKLEGYGIFYDKQVAANTTDGSINVQVFEFNGAADLYEFTLTKFVPHPDLLKVYDVKTGQVYTYGAFGLDGQKVIFEPGQFLQPGETIILRFVQIEGAVFDSSDANALLLASNRLGSTDPSIDRSIPGRGILLRRPDGTLREISIDNSDNIVISTVP